MEKDNKYALYNDFGIYELRNIARDKGVESPTTKRKKELIEEILKIENGLLKPYIRKNNQGRPHKNCIKLNYEKIIETKQTLIEEKEISYIRNINLFLENLKILHFKLYSEISNFMESSKDFLKEE